MREIDVRNEQDETQDCTVKIKFGEDGEFLKHSQGDDTFSIADGDDTLYLWAKDLPMLKKALEKLEEFTIPVGDDDDEEF